MVLSLGSGSSYSVGNRVYRGGSPAPHYGTLDIGGFIQRSLNQSNRRSGLAQSLLAQRNAPKPITHPSSLTTARNVVATSPTGKLSFAPAQSSNPNDASNVMPFSDALASGQDSLVKSRDDSLNNLQQLRQQLQEKVTGQERTIDQNAPELARQLLDKYAGRGLAYSSGYGYGVGQQQQAESDQKAALEQQLQEGLANYNSQQQGINDQYQQALSQLQYQVAAQQAQALAQQQAANQFVANTTGNAPAPKLSTPVLAKKVTAPAPVKSPARIPSKTAVATARRLLPTLHMRFRAF